MVTDPPHPLCAEGPSVRRLGTGGQALPGVGRSDLLPSTQRHYDAGMPLLRAVVLPGLGAIAVLAAAGRAIRLLGGDDPREDRAVRALQDAFGHAPDEGDAAVATNPADPTGPREPIDRITEPLSWYSDVPQTIANGALRDGRVFHTIRLPDDPYPASLSSAPR